MIITYLEIYHIHIMTLKNLFNWSHYIELNKDLHHLTNENDAIEHWKNIGYHQMRLCNKLQLNVINEFGNEIILYISYYYYLYINNLLFDNKITTYKGMKPYYYFLNDDMIIEKENTRYWTPPSDNPLLVNYHEHVKIFDKKYWMPPPYKSVYKNDIIKFDKPILVIHNKYKFYR